MKASGKAKRERVDGADRRAGGKRKINSRVVQRKRSSIINIYKVVKKVTDAERGKSNPSKVGRSQKRSKKSKT